MTTCETPLSMEPWVVHMRYAIEPSPVSMRQLASSRRVCVGIVMSPYICRVLHAGSSRRNNVTATESAMVLACLLLSSSNRGKERTNRRKPRLTFFIAFYIYHPYIGIRSGILARLMQGSMMVLIPSISWYRIRKCLTYCTIFPVRLAYDDSTWPNLISSMPQVFCACVSTHRIDIGRETSYHMHSIALPNINQRV
jgi:hypothetical protein